MPSPGSPNSSSRRPTRRKFLQVGYSGLLGVSTASVWEGLARANSTAPLGASRRTRAKSVILVFLPGGASQLDTFDLKPEAAVESRGTFQPIATRTPGLDVCEHLPQLAQ